MKAPKRNVQFGCVTQFADSPNADPIMTPTTPTTKSKFLMNQSDQDEALKNSQESNFKTVQKEKTLQLTSQALDQSSPDPSLARSIGGPF